jgi:hypothetical protein
LAASICSSAFAAPLSTNVYAVGGFLKDLNQDGHNDLTALWDGEHWWGWSFNLDCAEKPPHFLVRRV